MGNWKFTVSGFGPHHNPGIVSADADRLAANFLNAAGQSHRDVAARFEVLSDTGDVLQSFQRNELEARGRSSPLDARTVRMFVKWPSGIEEVVFGVEESLAILREIAEDGTPMSDVEWESRCSTHSPSAAPTGERGTPTPEYLDDWRLMNRAVDRIAAEFSRQGLTLSREQRRIIQSECAQAMHGSATRVAANLQRFATTPPPRDDEPATTPTDRAKVVAIVKREWQRHNFMSGDVVHQAIADALCAALLPSPSDGQRETEKPTLRTVTLSQNQEAFVHDKGDVVMRVSDYCAAIWTWMDKAGERYGPEYQTMLDRIRTDIQKSALLWRLIYRGEKLRTVECPKHKGKWHGPEWIGMETCPHDCDGTGYLRSSAVTVSTTPKKEEK